MFVMRELEKGRELVECWRCHGNILTAQSDESHYQTTASRTIDGY